MTTNNNAPVTREWTVDGVVRQALVYAPPQATSDVTPVVFAFHGHSGTMGGAAALYAFQAIWPAALVVYMQGLNTPGVLYDPEGKLPGWQHVVGGQGDRDLKFFDAVLATLRQEYRVDDQRVYATGHSNGGFFVYLLWATRGDRLAAVAPTAAAVVTTLGKLPPKPVLVVAGQNDLGVKFSWQQEAINLLRQRNDCGAGQPLGQAEWSTLYPSRLGAPVVACIHPGGHELPATAPALVVKFFQESARL